MDDVELTLFEMHENRDADGVVCLALSGELDLVGADKLTARLRDLQSTGTAVRLDLSQLEFIDSSGLSTLIKRAQASRRDGWRLELDRRLQPQVERVIELIGASPILWPFGDRVAQDG